MKRNLVLIIALLFTTASFTQAGQIGLKWRYTLPDSISVLYGQQNEDITTLVTTKGMIGISTQTGLPVWGHDFPEYTDQSIGLPVIDKSVAVYVSYLNSKTIEKPENGIAQLTGIDLKDGSVLWSAYLPGYLPLSKTINGDYLYLTCKQTGKLLKSDQIYGVWKSHFVDRSNSWLLALDVTTGKIKWHIKTDEWSHYLGTIDKVDYFARYKKRGIDWKTLLDARNPEDGSKIWTSHSGYDRTEYISILPHPRGIVAISDGLEKSYTHLIHKVSGEVIAKLRFSPGYMSFIEDTLWNCSVIVEKGLKSRFDIQSIDWNGFRILKGNSKIKDNLDFGDLWMQNSLVGNRIYDDPSFWSSIQPQLSKRNKTPFLKKFGNKGKILLFPDDIPKINPVSAFIRGSELYLSSLSDGTGIWKRIALNKEKNQIWRFEIEDIKQQPILLNSIFDSKLITAYDGAVLAIDPESGDSYLAQPRWKGILSLEMFHYRKGFAVVTNRGLDYYYVLKPLPEKVSKPEPEKVVLPIPQPEVVIPVVLDLPEPEPKKKPVYIKQRVFRVQLMFLSKTSMRRAEILADNIAKKLGYEVHVVQIPNGIKLQAGDFIKKSDANKALGEIRENGYGDAFIAITTIEILKDE